MHQIDQKSQSYSSFHNRLMLSCMHTIILDYVCTCNHWHPIICMRCQHIGLHFPVQPWLLSAHQYRQYILIEPRVHVVNTDHLVKGYVDHGHLDAIVHTDLALYSPLES